MKATDFNLSREISFNPDEGITTFRNNRLILLDANAMGLLRQSIIEKLGFEEARKLFLRFGFENGYADFIQMKTAYGNKYDTEIDLLASGPVIHTWEGIVYAEPIEIDFSRDTGHFYFTGKWINSYEAEQHLSYNDKSEKPVCWTLMGYASGWCTAFFGRPLLAIEPVCIGKGDDHCEWKILNLEAWGEEANPYKEALSDLFNKINSAGR